MAATGFTPLQIYSSSTTTNVPSAGNLLNNTVGSELAINITDGKLFYKDNANAVQVIGWKVVPATAGGTGQTSYAVGDILYASTTTALSKLADVATGNALISGGVGVAPSYGKIGLTTHVSGVLPVANGGTNASSASITAFNNITGYTASGATGTTSTNLVFSTSPTLITPTLGAALATSIKFGSGTVLDSYEEGTWTPVVADATSGGNTATVGTTVARYTKIGRTVFVQASLDNIDTTGMTAGNNLSIRGLPFANAAGLITIGSCVMSRVSYSFNSWRPQIDPTLSLVQFTEFSTTNANYTTMKVSNILATTSDIYFSVMYTI